MMAAQNEHAQIKATMAEIEASLGRRGSGAEAARELERLARLAAGAPERVATNLAVWGGLLEVVTKHRGALRAHLDAAGVLRSVDAAARAALAAAARDLAAAAVDLAAATRSARVLSFLCARYGGLAALLVAPGGGAGGASAPAAAFAATLADVHTALDAVARAASVFRGAPDARRRHPLGAAVARARRGARRGPRGARRRRAPRRDRARTGPSRARRRRRAHRPRP